MQTCSSCSLHAYSKYLAYPPRTSIPPLFLWPLSYLRLLSKKHKRIWFVPSSGCPNNGLNHCGYPQKRHHSDSELNARIAKVLNQSLGFDSRKWKDIQVGDVVRVESDEFIPADLVLISSSEPEGLCYIETSNLDGYVLEPFSQSCFRSHLCSFPGKRT